MYSTFVCKDEGESNKTLTNYETIYGSELR
jgi:hypothetical protein